MLSRSRSPQTIDAFAPAKINLTLHVTGQRPDGYHLLESLVAFADFGDRLWLTPGDEMRIDVEGPFADGVPEDARNLVWQACALAGWQGHVRLEKKLPHGAGIGGGSSDAAAVLGALKSDADGLSLGADVPVCRQGRAAMMRGIGEQVTPVALPVPVYAVLLNPMRHVATPAVFRGLAQKQNAPMPPMPQDPSEFWSWLADQRNDLEAPAIAAQHVISDALKTLSHHGARVVRMSGSGSTCFALFDSRGLNDVVAQDLARAHPDWWVQSCCLS